MTIFGWALLFSLVIVPLLGSMVDIIPTARAIRGVVTPIPEHRPTEEDFTVLVPIYGHIRYLENIEFLSSYGDRVVLVTTTTEKPSFNGDLARVARAHGFRIYRSPVHRASSGRAKKATAGTIRDRIIRDASLHCVTTPYVVCIDADTVTNEPIGEIVGALAANNLDFASVRLIPSNTKRMLGKLQAHEYRMVMRLRRIMPWVCSGAFHLGRHEAHREIMRRHSLFFQGNDVELGLIGKQLGYKVGHLAFDVPTVVPDKFRGWFRQRVAWSGGEFRLFIANPQLVLANPFFCFYGGIVVIMMLPLRWINLAQPGYYLATIFVIYWTILFLVNFKDRDFALFLYPFYGMFNSLIIVPFGLFSYLTMAIPEGNWGWIRLSVHRPRHRRRIIQTPPKRELAGSKAA